MSPSKAGQNAGAYECLQHCEYSKPIVKFLGRDRLALTMTVDGIHGLYIIRGLDAFDICENLYSPESECEDAAASDNLSSNCFYYKPLIPSSIGRQNRTYKAGHIHLFGEFDSISGLAVYHEPANNSWHGVISRSKPYPMSTGTPATSPVKNVSSKFNCNDQNLDESTGPRGLNYKLNLVSSRDASDLCLFSDELWNCNFELNLTIKLPGSSHLRGIMTPIFVSTGASGTGPSGLEIFENLSNYGAANGSTSPTKSSVSPSRNRSMVQASGISNRCVYFYHSSPIIEGDLFQVSGMLGPSKDGRIQPPPATRLTFCGRDIVNPATSSDKLDRIRIPRAIRIPRYVIADDDESQMTSIIYQDFPTADSGGLNGRSVTTTVSSTSNGGTNSSRKTHSLIDRNCISCLVFLPEIAHRFLENPKSVSGEISIQPLIWIPNVENSLIGTKFNWCNDYGPLHLALKGYMVIIPNIAGTHGFGIDNYLHGWGTARTGRTDLEDLFILGRYLHSKPTEKSFFKGLKNPFTNTVNNNTTIQSDSSNLGPGVLCSTTVSSSTTGSLAGSLNSPSKLGHLGSKKAYIRLAVEAPISLIGVGMKSGALALRALQRREAITTIVGDFCQAGSGEKGIIPCASATVSVFKSVFQCGIAIQPATNFCRELIECQSSKTGFILESTCRDWCLAISPVKDIVFDATKSVRSIKGDLISSKFTVNDTTKVAAADPPLAPVLLLYERTCESSLAHVKDYEEEVLAKFTGGVMNDSNPGSPSKRSWTRRQEACRIAAIDSNTNHNRLSLRKGDKGILNLKLSDNCSWITTIEEFLNDVLAPKK